MTEQTTTQPAPETHQQTSTAPATPVAAAARSADFQRLLEQPFSAFGSIGQFKDAQRMATMLCHSSIVPETYRGEEHIGDCVIALEIANRIGASILAVMQNLYLVHGKPGWSSQFLISCVNATKRFSPIRYEMRGTKGQDDWGCIAWATDKGGTPLKSPEVTIKMAKDEGWYGKNGSKWKTMPELMLCYRAATLFTRLYAPEITMGIQTAEEIVDVGTPSEPKRPVFDGPTPMEPAAAQETASAIDNAVIDKPYEYLQMMCKRDGVTESQVHRFMVNQKLAGPKTEELIQASDANMRALIKTWQAVLPKIKAIVNTAVQS